MADRRKPGVKDFDGKEPKSPFQTVEKCQEFCSRIFEYTSKAEKEYRQTICKKVQEYACEMVHSARLANSISIKDPYRQDTHRNALEYMERINDLLPVLRRCRCLTPNQESEMHKKFNNLRYGYRKWIESDERRIAETMKTWG